MFRFLKKKTNKLPIAEAMKIAANKAKGEYGAALMYKDQVLFQLIQSKFFEQHGFKHKIYQSFSELHFFNKNKTATIEYHSIFKDLTKTGEYYYFENPIGNHTYIKEIGIDLLEIEKISKKRISEIYKLDLDVLDLRIDY